MAIKDAFSEDDWDAVVQAPMISSFAITAADPGGLWSAVKEATATARAMTAARDESEAGTLAAAVVGAYADGETRSDARGGLKELVRGKTPAEATGAALKRLGEIAHIVDRAVPEDAESFKRWLRDVAGKVAEAGTEGGFMGFGGVKVSEAEVKTLADIDDALGLGQSTG